MAKINLCWPRAQDKKRGRLTQFKNAFWKMPITYTHPIPIRLNKTRKLLERERERERERETCRNKTDDISTSVE